MVFLFTPSGWIIMFPSPGAHFTFFRSTLTALLLNSVSLTLQSFYDILTIFFSNPPLQKLDSICFLGILLQSLVPLMLLFIVSTSNCLEFISWSNLVTSGFPEAPAIKESTSAVSKFPQQRSSHHCQLLQFPGLLYLYEPLSQSSWYICKVLLCFISLICGTPCSVPALLSAIHAYSFLGGLFVPFLSTWRHLKQLRTRINNDEVLYEQLSPSRLYISLGSQFISLQVKQATALNDLPCLP